MAEHNVNVRLPMHSLDSHYLHFLCVPVFICSTSLPAWAVIFCALIKTIQSSVWKSLGISVYFYDQNISDNQAINILLTQVLLKVFVQSCESLYCKWR